MNPIARLRNRYHDPDQFIARAEVAWFRRWMRTRGWMWVVLFAALRFLSIIDFNLGLSALQSVQVWPGTTMGGTLFVWLAFSFCWLGELLITATLMERRCLAPFRPGCVEDLRLTSVRATTLWPALAAAPILFLAACGLAGWSAIFLGEAVTGGLMNYSFTSARGPASLAEIAAAIFLTKGLALASLLVLSLALVLFPIRMLIPRGGRFGLFGIMVALQCLFFLVEMMPSILRGLTGLSAGGGRPMTFVWSMFRLIAETQVAAFSLRWLCSEKGFRKMLGEEPQS